MFVLSIVFVFSFITARSANKGASGLHSDWLPAEAPDAAVPRAPPQQMDLSRSPPPPPPPSSCYWMHEPQWLFPTAGKRASWPRSLTVSGQLSRGNGRGAKRRRTKGTGEPASPSLVSRNVISKSRQELERSFDVAKWADHDAASRLM